ncbi:ParB/RepB/Spo0J family partition protein [Natroniella sulfidigena]|uniref:ParB/RepB/Spo0J family partition protein n=1 Tax=Natroniella sulfidigena TaxID=723921 RepID=UPI00200B7D98|nr:ParB/RepB/Spo0J family partition protein [Natroniella sulfidigena]MCK8816623.1 ParB/RepB/Spo0J family partition protein [Natroniella sulfidigena]
MKESNLAERISKEESIIDEELNKVIKIPLELIEPNPYQPRSDFAASKLRELSQSIKEQGLIQPILVRTVGQKYQIVAGERRYRAVKSLGREKIEAIVIEVKKEEMMEIALVENLQRESLNPIEEAKAYQKLITEFSLAQQELATKVGKSRSAVANSLRLLKLPNEIKELLITEQITKGHARALLALSSIKLQQQVASQIINEELTVRQTEQLIKKVKAEEGKSEQDDSKQKKDPNVAFIEKRLMNILGTKVDINPGKKKGKIVIEYYSTEDLERVIEVMEQ